MSARLYLFDDARARAWRPFSDTRPVGELLFGCLTFRERAERALGLGAHGHLVGDALRGFEEPGAPPTLRPSDLPGDVPRVLLSSRAALDLGAAPLAGLGSEPATLTVGGEVVGWVVPARRPAPDAAALAAPDAASGEGRALALAGKVLAWPWSLVESNAERTLADLVAPAGLGRSTPRRSLEDPEPFPGVHRFGAHPLLLGEGAEVGPGVVVDTRDGPVHLDDGARVDGPARLTGPLHVGTGCHVFGGSLSHSSIGPVCKVRGEIDTSVLSGYCNKAHDGYLGHALLGAWVNLGALTTNSDLKNNYSPVRVRLGDEEIDTGLLKVGCFLGDHVKTGIGTLLNTGTAVGAGSNVFGGGMPPRWVPPFSWGSGSELVEFRLDKFFEVAEAAMRRRGVELTPAAREMFARAWERTRAERTRG